MSNWQPIETAPKDGGAGRGRINGIFDCYGSPGPMSCYEPEAAREKK